MSERTKGAWLGAAAYLMWGLFPLYWPLLKPLGALEILAHRIVWSLLVVAGLLMWTRQLTWWKRTDRARLGWLALAAIFILLNWGLYIWAVNNQHVVESSLGYFINPLMTVLLGVTLLGEKLRRLQWLSLGAAAVAVVVVSVDTGRPPWIALGLAPSFALYGLMKKKAGLGAAESLSFETAVWFFPALAYLGWLELNGTGGFGHVPLAKEALLVGSGALTALPLLCFGAAANRVPLSTLGVLQYLSPSLQFLCGVLIQGETMSPSRWVGFALVWVSLAGFAFEGVVHRVRSNGLATS